MSQHDFTVDNASGATVRGDINNALQALATLSAGTAAPSPTFANQLWADTTNNLLKKRNNANSAWVTIGTLDATNLGLLALSGGSLTGAFNDNDVTLASASTVNIGAAGGRSVNISGTTGITAFDTVQAGAVRKLRFAGILTLTHNATSLILPGAANITTAAGDTAEFLSLGSGNWKCFDYTKADGTSLVSGASGFRNWLLNSAMDVWQRGAGGSASIAVAASTTAYTADRWYLATLANQASVVSQQTGPTGFRYAARVQRNSGQTGTGVMVYAETLDSDYIAKLAGKTCVLSAQVSTGANWSPASGTLSYKVYCGTGAVGKRNATPYTGESSPISGSTNFAQGASSAGITAASGAIPSNTTQMEVQFFWTPAGTAGANDWFQVTGIQLEIGSSATAFDASRLDFPAELAKCQRFYQKSFPYATAPAQNAGLTGALQYSASTAAITYVSYQPMTRMRTSPSVTTFNPSNSNANWRDVTNSADLAVTVDQASEAIIGLHAATGTGTSSPRTAIHLTLDAEI